MSKKRILVAVLNWGLGHATRSLPIVSALLNEGFEVILASEGEALQLLRKEFPALQWIVLPSYNITYPNNGTRLRMHLLKKSLQIMRAIRAENRLIGRVCAEKRIDGIYSDNRLGAFAKGIPSVYCTHQIQVLSGSTTWFTTKLHQYFINKFSECWIPDQEGENKLSGEMGHSKSLNIPIHYLGIVSRLEIKSSNIDYDLLVLLSGPEPHRGLLEQQLLRELKSFQGNVVMVRGKVEEDISSYRRDNVLIYNYLPAARLEAVINASALVLARSGYSTILDLAVLGKRAFFIPTPGQYEQEYLAIRMKELKIAPFCTQEEFRLEKLQEAASCSGFSGFARASSFTERLAFFKGE